MDTVKAMLSNGTASVFNGVRRINGPIHANVGGVRDVVGTWFDYACALIEGCDEGDYALQCMQWVFYALPYLIWLMLAFVTSLVVMLALFLIVTTIRALLVVCLRGGVIGCNMAIATIVTLLQCLQLCLDQARWRKA